MWKYFFNDIHTSQKKFLVEVTVENTYILSALWINYSVLKGLKPVFIYTVHVTASKTKDNM
jgi:hypothetical protein